MPITITCVIVVLCTGVGMEDVSQQISKQMGGRRLTTILVADICGYSALSEKDEAAAIDLADNLFGLFTECVESEQGRVFNRIADGFLAEFPSARGGMNAALAFCRRVEGTPDEESKADRRVRIGLHVGEVTDRDDGDLLGHGVNVAVRLQEAAYPNTVLTSQNVLNLLSDKSKLNAKSRGKILLKNINDPITAIDVTYQKWTILSRVKARMSKIKWHSAAIPALTLFVIFIYVQIQTREQIISTDQIIQKYFSEAEDQSFERGFSDDYLRYVIENLNGSNVDSERAAYELLKSGNVSGAIENLERYRFGRLNSKIMKMAYSSKEHIELMHQLAALSYHHDPVKAKSYYQAILAVSPEDTRAKIWLARAQNQRGEGDEAARTASNIDIEAVLSQEDLIQLKLDKAFTDLLKHDFVSGVAKLRALEPEILSINQARLVVEWKTNLAIGLERLDKLDEAEKLVAEVVNELNKIGPDSNMPRAYNVWGQIIEKRAEAQLPLDSGMLRTSLEKYEMQVEFANALNKQADIAEAQHYMGFVLLKLNDLQSANEAFLLGLQVAEDLNLRRSAFRNKLGLTYSSAIDETTPINCSLFRELKEVYKNDKIPLKPSNLEKFRSLEAQCSIK